MDIVSANAGRNMSLPVPRGGMMELDDRYQQGNPYAEEEQGSLNIDFRAIYTILRRNLLLIVGVIVLFLIAGLTVTLLMTPQYEATASIQVDQESDQVLNNNTDIEPTTSFQDADRFLQTQVDVLHSRAMTERVANTIHLVGNQQFFDKMRVSPPKPKDGVDRTQQLKDASLELVSDNLSIAMPHESRVIPITFRSPDAALAAQIANTYATQFISSNLQRKYDSSTYAREFLSTQLAAAKTRLEVSERDLNAYARTAGLIKTADATENTSGGAQSLTTSSLVQINTAANDARSARVAAEEKWRTTQATPLMDVPDVLTNSAIQTMLQRQAELQSQLSEELSHHKAPYPSVIALQSQVDQIAKQIEALATDIRSAVKTQYDAALRQEQSLNGQVKSLTGDTLAEQDRSVQYNILARDADTNRTLYDGLLQRYKDLSAAAGVTTNNISIIDQADAPTKPSSPRLALNMALALLLGVAAAGAIVFAKEQMDDAVRIPEDLERKLGLHSLGVIPKVKADEDLLELLESPRSALSEAYHALRTSLLYSTVESLPRTLLITSSQSGEGKSTTSFAIASDLARLDKRVVLVDTDLRRPSLHRMLNAKNEAGLSSVLTRQVKLDQAIQPTSFENLSFLSSGPIPPSPTELLGSARMRELLDHLTQQFDVVVLDGPPVLGLADAPILAAAAEGTIFVVESNRGHRGSTKTAVRRLQSAHSRLLGGVLTKFDPKQSGNSQYYGYEYYYYGITDERASDEQLPA